MQIKSLLLLSVLSTIAIGAAVPSRDIDPNPGCIRFCTELDFDGECYDEKIEFDKCKAIPHWQTTGDVGSNFEVKLPRAP